ncbi:hypothetical protein GBAR_LOCUS12985 [Geodia barretti]|uniref:Uncharacterized protein n=1 Tax=Geodia barretti TaxID=519541 RepID=A0AA35S4N2_GEOBA|nr:hypothetical protein GBAR_LOCUS12985 [Geodia barretti]
MITGTDQSTVVSVGASDSATVTITDNDAGEVEVAAASVGITEGGAAGSVCVVLTGTTGSPTELSNPLAVSVASVLNADAGAVDFSLGASVTIPAGTTLPTDGSHCVAVSGTEDTLLEEMKRLGLESLGQTKVPSFLLEHQTLHCYNH